MYYKVSTTQGLCPQPKYAQLNLKQSLASVLGMLKGKAFLSLFKLKLAIAFI